MLFRRFCVKWKNPGFSISPKLGFQLFRVCELLCTCRTDTHLVLAPSPPHHSPTSRIDLSATPVTFRDAQDTRDPPRTAQRGRARPRHCPGPDIANAYFFHMTLGTRLLQPQSATPMFVPSWKRCLQNYFCRILKSCKNI